MKSIKILIRTWYTGLLYCLAAAGYVFYWLLMTMRIIQTSKLIRIIISVALLCAGVAAILLIFPLRSPGGEVDFIVEPGMSIRTISRRLEEKQVVGCRYTMEAWLRLTGASKSVQAGRFRFAEHEGVRSAARKLLRAEPLFITITIPEGLTIEQTASRCAGVLGIDSAAFVRACSDAANVRRIGHGALSLEGYLFPDTYRFEPSPSARDVLARMVAKFEKVYASLDTGTAGCGLSRSETVTLASIVEKEAALAAERAHIAGVFCNRLRQGYTLGADPTVRYALRKFSGPLRVSELNNPSPYNTRIHRGLPPGPICSPGTGALQAALNPMETRDMYFVAKWDGSGAHDFSISNAEHERKKHEIRRLNEMHKNQKLRGANEP